MAVRGSGVRIRFVEVLVASRSEHLCVRHNLIQEFRIGKDSLINQHTLYPYVHSFSNIRDEPSMLRRVKFPDVNPSSLSADLNFSLVAGKHEPRGSRWFIAYSRIIGDFEEIYGGEEDEDPEEPQAGLFDAILTCFFIDTVCTPLRPLYAFLTDTLRRRRT